MASQNNVHIPDELLSAMNAAAKAEGKTADDLLAEAARRYLEHKELDDLVGRGRRHAERSDHRPSDAVKAVRDVRRGR
jgi:hypothetical protein